jgi:epoxyqueuosine reductase
VNKVIITKQIYDKAIQLGFSDVGFAQVNGLSDEKDNYKNWLNKGYHADMNYLANNFNKRLNPVLLLENAKTVISVIINYYPGQSQEKNVPIVSKYAFGRDYHKVLKNKLKDLANYINQELSPINYRYFTDSAPVLERKWAQLSGLGWIGKNSLLINKKLGSFFFIGELIVDIELEYSNQVKDLCGSCTKCIDACPTNAIIKDKVIDSNKCISYLTIENKNTISKEFKNKFKNRVFGCDICQDVCPWNNKKIITDEKDFIPKKEFISMKNEDWLNLDEDNYNLIFNGTAVKRSKFLGLKRNIQYINHE